MRGDLIELGPKSLTEGLKLLDERSAYYGQFFESGEEAMAKTSLGFQRDPDDFIAIDVVDPGLTVVRAGCGITDGREETVRLDDLQALRTLVTAYFRQPRDFPNYWRSLETRERV